MSSTVAVILWTWKESKSHLPEGEINLKSPISTMQMIFKRCQESGVGKREQLLLPEEQRKSCHTPKIRSIDYYLGKIVLAFETFLDGIASYCSIQTSEIVGFKRQTFISVFLLMPMCFPPCCCVPCSCHVCPLLCVCVTLL